MTVTTTPYVRANGPDYGTMAYYSEMFSDILCDVGEGEDTKTTVLAGLLDALKSWIDYHDKAACQYEDFAIELNNLVKELLA